MDVAVLLVHYGRIGRLGGLRHVCGGKSRVRLDVCWNVFELGSVTCLLRASRGGTDTVYIQRYFETLDSVIQRSYEVVRAIHELAFKHRGSPYSGCDWSRRHAMTCLGWKATTGHILRRKSDCPNLLWAEEMCEPIATAK